MEHCLEEFQIDITSMASSFAINSETVQYVYGVYGISTDEYVYYEIER